MKEIKIILSGCRGRLGSYVASLAEERGCRIVCGVDKAAANGALPFSVYEGFEEIPEEVKADVMVDCSHHSLTGDLLRFVEGRRMPAVVCTTGQTSDEEDAIRNASRNIPILRSRNMSLGINLLMELVKKTAAALGEDFDIEIVEAHHKKKLDAPSGTALMLADSVRETPGREDSEYIYDRHDVRRQRGKNEIGIHSVRGGTIVGEHSVIFAGEDEVITISHSAGSRRLFAAGALSAARYLVDKPSGLYTMGNVVSDAL